MSRPVPPSYKTKNWPAYNEALKQRGSLTIWFDPDMAWVPPPTGMREPFLARRAARAATPSRLGRGTRQAYWKKRPRVSRDCD